MTLNLPLRRRPRGPLSLKFTEDAPKVVFVNFYLLQGGVVKDIMRKSVIFFGGLNIFYGVLTLKLPLRGVLGIHCPLNSQRMLLSLSL